MEYKDVLDTMTGEYNNLTKSGRKAADYIFAHRVEAQYMSITALAAECGVAAPTLSRFCRTLGFSGYNDFKLALAKASGAPAADDEVGIYGKVLPEDSITDMCKKLYATNVAAIGQTLAQIDEENVGRAVKYLSAAQRVYCFGQGGSLVIAMEAWARFITAAPQFQCIEDSHMQAMMASTMTKGETAVVFSYSGATKDTIHVAELAKRAGATVICVTRFVKSPLTSFSDVTLLCGANEGPLQGGSTSAEISQLFLIDLLYTEYYRRYYDTCSINNEKTSASVMEKLC